MSLAHAQSVTLLPPEPRWITGQPVTLSALVGDAAAPAQLTVHVTNARGLLVPIPAQLKGRDGSVAQYQAVVPADATGRLLVRLESDRRAPYVVEILPSGLTQTAPVDPTYGEEMDAAQPRAPAPVEFTWVDAFYTHEPLYFVAGATSDSDSKFQLSFKYQIYTPTPGLPKRLADGWLAPRGLYATYTQTSLWDIASSSSPFRDTSYKPGLYWQERDLLIQENENGRTRLSLMGGVEHESNGRGEPESRSINIVALRPTLGYVTSSHWRFLVSPKFYAYIEKDENPDIADYRGHVDLLVTVRAPSKSPDGGLQLALLGRLGNTGQNGSVQADLTYPFRIFGVPGYVHAQVFSGDGETILDYNQRRDTQYRLGFAAIR